MLKYYRQDIYEYLCISLCTNSYGEKAEEVGVYLCPSEPILNYAILFLVFMCNVSRSTIFRANRVRHLRSVVQALFFAITHILYHFHS